MIKKNFHDEAIIKLKNNFNNDNKIKCNIGKIIKSFMSSFNKENKIILTLEINHSEIGKKIYFLQNFDYIWKDEEKFMLKHKLNMNNYIIFIDDKIYESKNYFIPEKSGIYNIIIFINSAIKDSFGLFYSCRNIINIDLFSFDTNNAIDMSYMFYNCLNLKNINLDQFDTNNVINMSYMFHNCQSLTNIDLSSFDTKKVINMEYMFYSFKSLTNIDLSSFDKKKL